MADTPKNFGKAREPIPLYIYMYNNMHLQSYNSQVLAVTVTVGLCECLLSHGYQAAVNIGQILSMPRVIGRYTRRDTMVYSLLCIAMMIVLIMCYNPNMMQNERVNSKFPALPVNDKNSRIQDESIKLDKYITQQYRVRSRIKVYREDMLSLKKNILNQNNDGKLVEQWCHGNIEELCRKYSNSEFDTLVSRRFIMCNATPRGIKCILYCGSVHHCLFICMLTIPRWMPCYIADMTNAIIMLFYSCTYSGKVFLEETDEARTPNSEDCTHDTLRQRQYCAPDDNTVPSATKLCEPGATMLNMMVTDICSRNGTTNLIQSNVCRWQCRGKGIKRCIYLRCVRPVCPSRFMRYLYCKINVPTINVNVTVNTCHSISNSRDSVQNVQLCYLLLKTESIVIYV